MANPLLLEICVESVDHAIAAERGGADRIELCTDLASGGITPSAELMQSARQQVQVPIHALIRPRAGDFCYSDSEFAEMRSQIGAAKQLGMDGVVLGILDQRANVDIERTRALVEFAKPLSVTFHRAFDATHNLERSLEDVMQTGASRILTSAGKSRALDGLPALARLVRGAGTRIRIMPCGGINSENVAHIVRTTSAQEIHSSAGTSTAHSDGNGGSGALSVEAGSGARPELFEQKVAKLVNVLGGIARDERKR